MSTFLLVFIVAVVVIWVLMIAYTGYRDASEVKKAVPMSTLRVSDYKKIEMPVSSEDDKKSSLTTHLLNENLKKPSAAPIGRQELKPAGQSPILSTDSKIEFVDPVDENDISPAEQKNVSAPAAEIPLADEPAAIDQRDEHIKSLQETIAVISEKNDQLRAQIQEQVNGSVEMQRRMDEQKTEMEYIQNQANLKIQLAQNELAEVQKDKDVLAAEIQKLNVDKLKHQELLEEYNVLNKKNAAIASESKENAALRNEIVMLEAAKMELEERNAVLEDQTRQLLEKEKSLNMELTKQRAKILGLETICEDFKLQMEQSL